MSRDVRLFLEDILESGTRVIEYSRGLSLESFSANKMAYDAILRNLEVIGQAAKNVPPEVRQRHPEIEWRKIAGLRDVVAHEYFGLEDETLWDIVEHQVPSLVNEIKRVLETEI